MAALPPSNTARFKVFYTNQDVQHSIVVRSTPVSPATFGAQFDLFFDAINPLLPDTAIDSVEFAAQGSNIFNAVTTGIESNTYGSGITVEPLAANFISFIGRTAGGKRVRLFVFGINADTALNYRYTAGEIAAVDAAVALLPTMVGSFIGIDGLVPVWKTYANTGVNSHWQKALRP